MICSAGKFVFIHVPRTGGTSIESQLKKRFKIEGNKHQSMFEIMGNIDVSEFFKFTFVRNPWDLVISKYFAPYYSNINYLSGKTLSYFLENYSPAINEAGDSFFDFFNPDDMDFIGRFEDRDKGLEVISQKIGIDLDPHFSVKNKEMQKAKSKKKFWEYYDEETIEIVYNKYKLDIDYFNYKYPVAQE